jgi:hypothetical protein
MTERLASHRVRNLPSIRNGNKLTKNMLCYDNLFTKISPFTTLCTHSFSFYTGIDRKLGKSFIQPRTTTTIVIIQKISSGLSYARLALNSSSYVHIHTHITTTIINFFKIINFFIILTKNIHIWALRCRQSMYNGMIVVTYRIGLGLKVVTIIYIFFYF